MKTCDVGIYRNCLEITNGSFRLAVTTDFGPRIIGGFINDGPNIFKVLPNIPMRGIGTGFTLYGGHRLWHAPQAVPRTYAPDNAPVEVLETDDGFESYCGWRRYRHPQEHPD